MRFFKTFNILFIAVAFIHEWLPGVLDKVLQLVLQYLLGIAVAMFSVSIANDPAVLRTELGQALQLQSTVQVLVDPDSMSPTAVSLSLCRVSYVLCRVMCHASCVILLLIGRICCLCFCKVFVELRSYTYAKHRHA